MANKIVDLKVRGLIIGLFLLILAACGPMSKESYFDRYGVFIDKVSVEGEHYTVEDWNNADKEYAQYSEEWYRKFEDEFTFKEKLILSKYELQYNLIRAEDGVKSLFEGFLREDYDDLKEQVKRYAENDMQGDIEILLDQAKETGDSAVNMMVEILKELEIELKEVEHDR